MGATFREEYNGSETGYARLHGENNLNSVAYNSTYVLVTEIEDCKILNPCLHLSETFGPVARVELARPRNNFVLRTSCDLTV